MLTTFLVILFSELSFKSATLQELLHWYNMHPFAFIIAIQDIILGTLILFRIFNEFTTIEDSEDLDNFDNSEDHCEMYYRH